MQDENDGSNSKSFSENDLVLFTKEHPENSNVGVNMMGKVCGKLFCLHVIDKVESGMYMLENHEYYYSYST
jgi:hypothetical protein